MSNTDGKQSQIIETVYGRENDTYQVVEKEKITIDRRIYNHKNFTETFTSNSYNGFSVNHLLTDLYDRHLKPSGACATKQLMNRLPFIQTLKTYKSEYLLPDILTGITV